MIVIIIFTKDGKAWWNING